MVCAVFLPCRILYKLRGSLANVNFPLSDEEKAYLDTLTLPALMNTFKSGGTSQAMAGGMMGNHATVAAAAAAAAAAMAPGVPGAGMAQGMAQGATQATAPTAMTAAAIQQHQAVLGMPHQHQAHPVHVQHPVVHHSAHQHQQHPAAQQHQAHPTHAPGQEAMAMEAMAPPEMQMAHGA